MKGLTILSIIFLPLFIDAQITDTVIIDFSKPIIFEKIHTPVHKLIIKDEIAEEVTGYEATGIWNFNKVIVAGIKDCTYGFELKDSIIENVFLLANTESETEQLKELARKTCPDFNLKEADKNIYIFCGTKIFNGVLCMICYSENRKKETANPEINYTGDYSFIK